MTKEAQPEIPTPRLATEDWTKHEVSSLEARVEAGFLLQTKYLLDKIDLFKSEVTAKIDSQTRWMVGLMITMTVAIITAVLLK